MAEWWEAPIEHPPMEMPDAPAPTLFTAEQVAEQVAVAVAAAVEARAVGDDPKQAALDAIAEPGGSIT